MKTIPPGLAARLEGDATTLASAWRVTRRDGRVLGFTEHDRDLAFAGTVFAAASGFEASAGEAETGLAAETATVVGGLSSAAITEADLVAGRYDGARVEVFRVDWQMPEAHLLIAVKEIGEVTRAAGRFTAELRSFAHRLGQEQGRIYARRCDARLGDARCRVDLAAPGRNAAAAVVSLTDAAGFAVSGLDGFAPGHFALGRLTVTTGAAAGLAAEIEDDRQADGLRHIRLWLPLAIAPATGDLLALTVGCDKRFATCRDRFANALNFRGCPHLPDSDFAYSYADGESLHDGRPLYP